MFAPVRPDFRGKLDFTAKMVTIATCAVHNGMRNTVTLITPSSGKGFGQ